MTIIQTPVQPPRSPKHGRRHPVKFWLLAGLATLGGLIVLSGIVSAFSPAKVASPAPGATVSFSPSPTALRATPKAAPAAPSATAKAAPAPAAPRATQAPVAPQGPTERQRVAAWAAGPGYSSFQAVQADITAVTTDATGQNLPAVETDGATLAADAQNAAVSPPPVGSGEYQTAMKFYAIAGNDLAAGNIAAASTALQLGTAALNIVTADMKGLLPAS